MATVDPGELKYSLTIRRTIRRMDANYHYTEEIEETSCRCGIYSGRGGDRVQDNAARSVDTITFILRWEDRQRISRDSALEWRGRIYAVDWMDDTPWGGRYARVRAIGYDNAEG